MKANEKTILRFLESLDTKFIVPIYQRKYSWKIEEAKKLFDDIIFTAKNDFRNHFFGSIVTLYNDKSRDREYIIIDGQQRITSITLILLCIYKLAKNKVIEVDDRLKEKILNQYIINKYSDSYDNLKLRLTQTDNESFIELFESDNINSINNLSINYSYFYNRILKQEININDLYEAIKSLTIVEIELKLSEDNPQLIFDSLNSTGVSLTQADKIRNYIFIGKDDKKQKELYRNYYIHIEKRLGEDITDFISYYLMIKECRIVGFTKLYEAFKSYVLYNGISAIDILEELEEYSVYYSKILSLSFDSEISNIIKRLNVLGARALQPFMIILVRDYMTNIIEKYEFIEILSILESYLFRRIICKIPSNSLSKMFLNVIVDLRDKSNTDYIEIFKLVLLKQVDSLRFPREIEFKRSFLECEVYRLSQSKKVYMLERLENFENKEKLDIETLLREKVLEIEHIMPKVLSSSWKIDLGRDYKKVHSKYIHTIGNLTLTGYNPQMSNKSFKDKRDMKNGFKTSRIKLNRFLASKEIFTEKEILERSLLLFDDAKKIWRNISTTYKLSEYKKRLCYLSDDINLNEYKINGFIFEGILYESKSFKDVFDKVLNILYDIEPLLLSTIVKNAIKVDFLAFKISDNVDLIKSPYKIFDSLYVDRTLNNNIRSSILRYILSLYNINHDELSFYIQN